MNSETALDWGLVEEVAADGHAAERALELAHTAAQMPAVAVSMVKEAVNATTTALHHTASYADADQSQLSAATQDARGASERFNAK